MKVVFFVLKFPVSSETFILNQIDYFINRGIQVEIISVFPGDVGVNHAVMKNNDLMSRVRYLLPAEPKEKSKRILSRLSALKNILKKRTIVKSLNFNKYGYYSKTLLIPLILSHNNQNITADYIISHFGTTASLLNQLKRLGFVSGKTAAVFHGNEISQLRVLKLFNKDYVQLFKYADFIFPVSNLWATKINKEFKVSSKLSVVRMGIDINKFTYKQHQPIGDKLKLVTIARLTEKKGIETCIKACSVLLSMGVDFEYHIIGDGPEKSKLTNLSHSKGLGNSIFYHGLQSQEVISKFLDESDIFLLPSITASDGDMEGIPVALMEAMAVGLPVISSYHSGIPELIDDEISGYLIDERDYKSLASKVIKIKMLDHEHILRITRNARSKIEREYNRDNCYSELVSYLK
ncbi:TPA: glycosyltransferase [Klebsiella pneumoniae]|nr:glycosyltransferase [Klebsiella pneumoniae]